jgi:ribonuclease P protein subunit POP4
VRVLNDSNPSNINIKGKVVDETKNTLIIQSTGLKRVAKKNATFKFSLDGVAVKVEGKTLIGRPEDRVKKQNKKKW